ncbi:hypothetical protein ANCDUO_17599, partial [Ancylostoma duodenale]
ECNSAILECLEEIQAPGRGWHAYVTEPDKSSVVSALKKTFQQSNARKAFKKLSEYFIMVNTEDDEEPFEEEYRPDGKYIPRLLFLDKNGDLLEQFKNKKAEYKNYAYYYSSPADIINSMKEVLRFYEIEVPELRKPEKLKVPPHKQKELDDFIW